MGHRMLGPAVARLQVDGGAAQNDLLMQIQADVLGVAVERPQVIETTVRGAAFLAGLATGVWSSRDDLRAGLVIERRFEPAIGERERDARYAAWQDAMRRTLSER